VIKRTTWIFLALFVVVAIAAFFFQQNKSDQPDPEPTVTPQPPLLQAVDMNELTRIERFSANTDTLVLVTNEEGQWIFEEGESVRRGMVQELFSSLSSLAVLTSVESGTDLNAIGLEPAQNTIRLVGTNGISTTLEIGDLSPTGNGYYLRLNQTELYLVSAGGMESILDLLTSGALSLESNPDTVLPEASPEIQS
jgi:hypothetical protein